MHFHIVGGARCTSLQDAHAHAHLHVGDQAVVSVAHHRLVGELLGCLREETDRAKQEDCNQRGNLFIFGIFMFVFS